MSFILFLAGPFFFFRFLFLSSSASLRFPFNLLWLYFSEGSCSSQDFIAYCCICTFQKSSKKGFMYLYCLFYNGRTLTKIILKQSAPACNLQLDLDKYPSLTKEMTLRMFFYTYTCITPGIDNFLYNIVLYCIVFICLD